MNKKELTIEESALRERFRDMANSVFVAAILVWVLRFCLVGLTKLLASSLPYVVYATLSLLAECASVFFPFFLLLKHNRDKLMPIFREKPSGERLSPRLLLGILSVAGFSVGGVAATDLLLTWLDGNGVFSAISSPDFGETFPESIFYLLLSSLLLSFTYELCFRGISIPLLQKDNAVCAVFIASLAFAFINGDVHGIIVRLITGFSLGFFYLRVKSFYLCFVAGFFGNLVVNLWWLLLKDSDPVLPKFLAMDPVMINVFLAVIGVVIGGFATFFLFQMERPSVEQPISEPAAQTMKARVAFSQVFTSFGIFVLAAIVAFNVLLVTFSTEADPNDPLLKPTPEEGHIPPLFSDLENQINSLTSNKE